MFVIEKFGNLAMTVSTDVGKVDTFTIGRNRELVHESARLSVTEDEKIDREFAWMSLKGALEDQFGLPRSSKPKIVRGPWAALPDVPPAIKGKVVDAEGRPVVGADVTYDVVAAKKARTGPAGDFSVALDHGAKAAELTVDANGMASRHFKLFAIGDDENPRNHFEGPWIERNGHISEPLKLGPGTTVIGRLVRDGAPVAGVAVELRYRDPTTDDLGSEPECKTDDRGAFRFPHVQPQTEFSVAVELGSLADHGGVIPHRQHTQEDRTTLDLGDLRVQTGRILAGHIVWADSQGLRRGTHVGVIVPFARGQVERRN